MRVSLVGTYPGAAWKSIHNYCDALMSQSGAGGVEYAYEPASWWAPAPVRKLRDRVRGYGPLSLATPRDVTHIAEQGLGHHVATLLPQPVVITCHDVMRLVTPGFHANPASAALTRALLRASYAGLARAHRIAAPSVFTAEGLVSHCHVDPERIGVVPVPIGARFAPVPDAALWLTERHITWPNGPTMLSVGLDRRYKNLELLIRAMARPALVGVTLVRAGAPLTSRHRRLAGKLGVARRVVELGRVSDETLVRLYNAADVVVQPSLAEGFGMPVAEGMACGTPVVCSNGGALPEVAGDAAIVVPIDPRRPGDNGDVVAAFADAVASVIFDREIAAGAIAAGRLQALRFAPRAVVELLAPIYRQAVVEAATRGFA